MNAIDLKEEVRRAITSEWPAFAASHPKLAAAIDEAILIEPAMQSLADDPEYVEAMQAAATIGAGAEMAADVIGKVVRQWLQTLI